MHGTRAIVSTVLSFMLALMPTHLNIPFRVRVEGRRGLVQQHDLRGLEHGARNGDALLLSSVVGVSEWKQ